MNFTEFWAAYPAKSQHKGPKRKAEQFWNRLTIYEQHEVMVSLPVYENHLSENEWKNPMMARTYLGPQRCYESFQPPEKVQGQIDEIEARRKKIRAEKARQDAYAREQWADRFERAHGYRPERS